jgi:hypothetical protein
MALSGYEVTSVHSTIWILIFAPLCFSFLVWQILISSPKVGFPSIQFRLGKHGFWIILMISYVTMFTVALVERKI